MIRVVIESPFAGNVEENVAYARACLADSLRRGEAPFASHLLYTQPGVLDDEVLAEREQGIAAGFAWREAAQLTAVYTDLGITPGMKQGIDDARARGCPVECRALPGYHGGRAKRMCEALGGIVTGDRVVEVRRNDESIIPAKLADELRASMREALGAVDGDGRKVRCAMILRFTDCSGVEREQAVDQLTQIPIAEFSDEDGGGE